MLKELWKKENQTDKAVVTPGREVEKALVERNKRLSRYNWVRFPLGLFDFSTHRLFIDEKAPNNCAQIERMDSFLFDGYRVLTAWSDSNYLYFLFVKDE